MSLRSSFLNYIIPYVFTQQCRTDNSWDIDEKDKKKKKRSGSNLEVCPFNLNRFSFAPEEQNKTRKVFVCVQQPLTCPKAGGGMGKC